LITKPLAFLLALCLSNLSLLGAGSAPFAAKSIAQDEDYAYEQFTQEQLDNLLAPIALCPDPLLSQVLVAANFVDDVSARIQRSSPRPTPNTIPTRPGS
jgi:hypothetical protein